MISIIIVAYNSKKHLRVKVKNVPFKFSDNSEKEDSENGYINFCLVELDIESLEILELHYDGHKRFKIDIQSDESYFIAT